MRQRVVQIALAILVMSVGCSCDRPTSPSDEKIIWQASISDGELDCNIFPITLHEDKVIVFGMKGKDARMLAFNRHSGEKVWEGLLLLHPSYPFVDFAYVKDDILILDHGSRHYGIDLRSGEILWQKRGDRSGRTGVTGIGDLYFYPNEKAVCAGNVKTGDYWEAFSYQDSTDITRATTNAPAIFVSPQGDTMLVTTNSLYRYSNHEVTPFLTLYNYTKRQMLYTVQLAEADMRNPVDGLPVIYDDKVYVAVGTNIICCELWSGRQIWRARFEHNFLFSGFIIAEGKVIGNCEDRYMYALNPETGQLIWQTRTSGTSSRLFYMNGVVYFKGGGDGLFHAVDAATGRHIWKLRSPDLGRRSGAWFHANQQAGADGKVYVMSYLSLFCYKAAR